MTLTFVTALYDLGRREAAYTARTAAGLLDVARRSVLREPVPLVVYTDPELVAPLTEARRGLEPLTRIVALPLEDLPPWRELERVRALRTARPLANGNPRKDVPGYTVLTWAKFDLLDRTARDDPFRQPHLAWLDVGIGHVAAPPDGGLAAIAAAPTDRVSLCSMRYVHPSQVADRVEFCRFVRGHVCGGFFGGDAAHVVAVADACRAEIRACLDEGVAPNDEHVLAAVVARRRTELFRLYYGDYADILTSYDRVRGAHALVARSFREAVGWRDFEAAVDLGCGLMDGPVADDVELWLLLFQCAFAVGRHDVCDALVRVSASSRFPTPTPGPQALKVAVAQARCDVGRTSS